jgi:hypothetical protein
MFDATRSPGRSLDAAALRGLAEDLRTQLYADAPRLIKDTSTESWNRARVLATTAIGLLAYHAAMAEPGTQSQRIGRLLAVRDALMAQNLLDILAIERDRGPILVSANNAHLQRHPSRWATHWEGQDLAAQWNGAGSIVSPLLGDKYVYVAGSLGASGPVGLGQPEPGTYEERLGPETGIFPPPAGSDLHERVVDLLGYFPLDTVTIETCDAILHIGSAPGAADAARITGIPGVSETRIQPGSDMPPYTWGDRFFFAGEDRKRPFATIVLHDIPDFDEQSRLSEPGRYRLNIEVGRAEFRNLFGYGPEGGVALRHRWTRWTADRPVLSSDRVGQFVEGGDQAQVGRHAGGQPVVVTAQILHQPVPGDDYRGGPVVVQVSHRAQAALELAVVGFDRVVGVLLIVVPRLRPQLID